MPRQESQKSNVKCKDLVQLDPTLVAPNITAQGMNPGSGFVDRDTFLLQRFKKLQAETLIKEEQAELERLKKEKLTGELVSIEEVQEAFQVIGSKTKARLKRMISELPPKLEGLTANEMIDIIRNTVDEVLEDLSKDEYDLSELED